MSAREMGAALDRSPSSIEGARHRFGRYPAKGENLCLVCEERVVYAESPTARRWKLCKGCYLREMRMRQSEDAEANRVRQMKFRNRHRRTEEE